MIELVEIVRTVDSLNSWVRSDSFRRQYSTSAIRRMVYWYKDKALEEIHRAGADTNRLVVVSLTCRDCNGKKRYTDQYGFEHSGCRACLSTGIATLRFVETSIELAGEKFDWHSPYDYRSNFACRVVREMDEAVRNSYVLVRGGEDWQPNQRGRDLTVDDAAKYLLALESEHASNPARTYRSGYDWEFGRAALDYDDYSLDLGRVSTGKCRLCEKEISDPQVGWYHVCDRRIRWIAQACNRCRDKYRDRSVFEKLSYSKHFPTELITPNVALWIQKHQPAESKP